MGKVGVEWTTASRGPSRSMYLLLVYDRNVVIHFTKDYEATQLDRILCLMGDLQNRSPWAWVLLQTTRGPVNNREKDATQHRKNANADGAGPLAKIRGRPVFSWYQIFPP